MTSTTIALPGYRFIEPIYEGSRTRLYRGQRTWDQIPVIVKLLKSEYPTLCELTQFCNHYAVAKDLDLPGIVQTYNLEHYRNGFALVMEDFGGISLKDYITAKKLSLSEFFQIAIQIVQILETLYSFGIIHKQIKPDHLLIDRETKQVKLIDFSIASLLPRENQELQNPKILEGTLAYISPEQTGRMNRSIDYRTDFYSLGVTFYELLSGQLPFQSADPMELVHCHLARQPTPLLEVNPAIPPVINDTIVKLMAKMPEERYQSAFGLRCDLETCWQQWEANWSITYFTLGKRDISDRFQISEQLYGRETEVATLLAAFDRVAQGTTEIMLVAGFSGIGKTAVVNEVHKPIARCSGYFIKGKFDQFKGNIPFSALVQAFQNLMGQLLAESAASVQEWKAKILSALGENGQVIIDVIPELELLIGKQPPVPELEPSASQNRFNLLFQKFIRVFATKKHPLVIFLDDLQWADSTSLELIQWLVREADVRYLLLLGAYRDNEVSPAHPLRLTLEEIGKTEATVNQITLAPLDRPSLNRLIADTLSCSAELAVPLTDLVFQKTQGNPFFAIQFLKSLYQEKLISYCREGGYWQCDIAQVRALSVSDDLVEFMAGRLQKLPEKSQTVLKLAACIGNQFDLNTLAIVHEKSQAETAADLWRALQEGLILPISEIYKFFIEPESVEVAQASELSVPYRFLHDRVQQAAYFLIPEDQKQSTHLKIGQLLLNHRTVEEGEEKIFEIVNQLNMGLGLISRQTERDRLAQLNLTAGRKAKASTAYAAAFSYFTVGLELLAPDCWQRQYELTLALHESAAEAAYLSGDFKRMEQLNLVVFQQARSLLHQMKVYEVKILAWVAQSQPLEAVKSALQVLKLLGVSFPLKPSKLKILQAVLRTKFALRGKQIEDLIDLPKMSEPYQLAAMRIMGIVGSPAYYAAPELMPLLALKGVNLSVQHGNASMSAYGYASYGVILCGALGNIDLGYRFGQLALSLLDRFNAKELKARTFFVFNNFIRHWKEHLREGLKPLLEAYQSGLETGDLEFAAYSVYIYCYHCYFLGKELGELEREMATYSEAIAHLKQETALNLLALYRQVVLNLLGSVNNSCCLIGKSYDEQTALSRLLETNHRTAIFDIYFHKLILCYLFGQYSQALENAAIVQKYLDGATATLSVPIFHFYDSLAQLSVYPRAPKSRQKRLIAKVDANQRKIKKWAKAAPMNHLHKFYLVEAERHRVLGQNLEAMDDYDRAIKLAKENGYINEEALARELAAKFYLGLGKQTIAQTYLIAAYYSYARWGAKAKVEDLSKRYPDLLASIADTATSSSTDSWEVLDLAAVIKASQALSREIHLDRFLSTLLGTLIENGGGTKCSLILPSQVNSENELENLVVEATVVRGTAQATVRQSIPVQSSQEVPGKIVNYVWHTCEPLLLDDPATQAPWTADPYLIEHQPKSVLCTPILNQSKLIGILYLENHLTKGAFTSDRLEVLNLLCSQAAISLNNAKLYQNLQASNQALQQSVQALQKTKTELLQAQEKLRHDAFHDSLTGLPNRIWFSNLLEHTIQLSSRYPTYLYAVLFLDLDRFKVVNDSLGHLVGDELLKSVAIRLRNCLRAADTVARLGGDEFAILLEEMEDIWEATAVAKRIQGQLAKPFNLNNYQLFTGASIGIALGSPSYRRLEELLRDADAAMYHAKRSGKGHYAVFDPTMQIRVMTDLQLENDLRRSIKKQELHLYYQPIVSLSTGRLKSFEALVRWHQPLRGWVSPVEFIPVAEEIGLIDHLGWWVLESACRQLSIWLSQFPDKQHLTINVNFSAVQLKQVDLLERIEEILLETGLPQSCLKLEITESCILETFTSPAKRLKQLKDLGIRLCIDDFGTGYSCLSRLHEFPIDTLKIDRSFVSRMNIDSHSTETIQMIVTLAHSLGMDVVAEGVETTAQREKLRELGCDFAQGYLFSQPADSQTASQLLLKDIQRKSV